MNENKPLTIVFIARVYADDCISGSVVYFSQLAENLVKLGCKVYAVVSTPLKERIGSQVINGVIVHKVYLPSKNSLINFIYRNWAYRNILKKINKFERIDLINIQESGFLIFIKRDKILRRIPCIYTFIAPVHYEILFDYRKLKKTFGFFERLGKYIKMKFQYIKYVLTEKSDLNYAKRIIVISEYVNSFLKKFSEEKFIEKTRKYSIGVFDNYFQNHSRNEFISLNSLVFFTLRRLEPRMGLENLLKAIAIVATKINSVEVKFIIGGRGILEEKLKSTAKELNIQSHVYFSGYLTEEEKNKYYSAADAFILPTEELEGFGIVAIEALAHNLPVIATNAGAIPEILNPICPELIAEGVSSEEIAKKIEYFISNSDHYKNTSRFREYAFNNYRWQNISRQLLSDFYTVKDENTSN